MDKLGVKHLCVLLRVRARRETGLSPVKYFY